MKHAFIFISALIIVMLSCTKSQVKDSLIAHSFPNETTVATIISTNLAEKNFAECVQRELANSISTLKFISEDEFRDAMFPWFESSTAPKSIEELGSTMNKPLVQSRIKGLDIRFVIFVGGHTLKGEYHGPFIVAGGYGGAGALGYTSSDRKSEISAFIWDIKEMASLGDVQVEKSGSFKWIGLILPIPIPVFTESAACSETAKRISNCLTGKGSGADK